MHATVLHRGPASARFMSCIDAHSAMSCIDHHSALIFEENSSVDILQPLAILTCMLLVHDVIVEVSALCFQLEVC